eukprot:TRINITY_DN2128_c0_g1_i2.p1 TRINITY_DN2128_c0_g1~~TRINITY_DN2128_c0_g1_i2.p1  ORF type:complete len:100 (+),score=9.49 TRINITY_DN2128_c0_g1_i2:77-376(+)
MHANPVIIIVAPNAQDHDNGSSKNIFPNTAVKKKLAAVLTTVAFTEPETSIALANIFIIKILLNISAPMHIILKLCCTKIIESDAKILPIISGARNPSI